MNASVLGTGLLNCWSEEHGSWLSKKLALVTVHHR